jgi:hypothetical protein
MSITTVSLGHLLTPFLRLSRMQIRPGRRDSRSCTPYLSILLGYRVINYTRDCLGLIYLLSVRLFMANYGVIHHTLFSRYE